MENDSPEMRKLNRLLAEKQKLSQQAAGHRSRLKERYQKYGAGGLPNHEFLELLLTYAIPRKDVKPLAKDLLAQFESIAGIINATPQELKSISGIGDSTVILFQLFRDLYSKYLEEDLKIRNFLSLETVQELIRLTLGSSPTEKLCVLFFAASNNMVGSWTFEGGPDCLLVRCREIFAKAISLNADKIVVAHNHPSGKMEPSEEDMLFSEKLERMAETIEISLLAHFLVGKTSCINILNRLIPD